MLNSIQNSRRERGFTLIELCIVVVIIGILMSIGVPAFRIWIQNTQIRTGAEGVLSGMQLARNEAVKRNTRVEFVLNNPGVKGGTGWEIRLVRDPNNENPLQTTPDGEGSRNVTITTTPAGSVLITFNGLGRSEITNSDGSKPPTKINFDNAELVAADKRDLRVEIQPGSGSARMCDPSVTIDKDTRKCNLP